MKNLAALNREALIQQTQTLVADEKRIDLELLDHLREIDRRMLHLEMGYGTLFDFAVQYLGLTEASAYRRLSAMRMIREMPEVKARLESGALSLSNLAAAETFFRAERKQGKSRSATEKKELLRQIEGLSKRECEKKLLEISPEAALPKERERALTPELTELRLVVDLETLGLLKQVRDAHPGLTTAQVIKRALKEAAREVEATRTPKFAPVQKSKTEQSGSVAEMRRQAFARSQGRCEFKSQDGRRCESRNGLEIDHSIPQARGGKNDPSNLRVLCRGHNSYEAVRILGAQVMRPYLPHLRGSP